MIMSSNPIVLRPYPRLLVITEILNYGLHHEQIVPQVFILPHRFISLLELWETAEPYRICTEALKDLSGYPRCSGK